MHNFQNAKLILLIMDAGTVDIIAYNLNISEV
jgi:hypothetical protein